MEKLVRPTAREIRRMLGHVEGHVEVTGIVVDAPQGKVRIQMEHEGLGWRHEFDTEKCRKKWRGR